MDISPALHRKIQLLAVGNAAQIDSPVLAAGLALGKLLGAVNVELEALRVLVDGHNPAVRTVGNSNNLVRTVLDGLTDKAITAEEHRDVIARQILRIARKLGPALNVIDGTGNGNGGTLAGHLRGTKVGKGLISPADCAGGRGRGYQP